MLKRLAINNYALIDALDISFPEHLVIITGETGAGKSILLGALSLLVGAKMDVSVIKDRSRNCVVEAEFSDEGEDVILRRVVTPQGRSRIFINDEPATMEELKVLSGRLIDIHSQNSQHLLADDRFQLSVLDFFSGNEELLKRYEKAYDCLKGARMDLSELNAAIAEQERDREYVEYQYEQLKAANLSEGNLEALEDEQRKLANAENIRLNLSAAIDSIDNDMFSFSSRLKEAEQSLKKVSSYVSSIDSLGGRLENCRIEIKDIEDDLERLLSETVTNEDRLNDVETHIAQIYDLLHKHGKTTESDLIALRDSYAARLGVGEDLHEKKEELEKRCSAYDVECETLACELHANRQSNVNKLSSLLQESIRNLEIPFAIFAVDLRQLAERNRYGRDSVRFLFSANGGTDAKELSKCASGGEISRIMLCIKALVAKYASMPTMIFDEIDTGVSGSVADKVGRMIVEMGKDMQVFAITHLPQVASKGDAHFLVHKNVTEEGATTEIRQIKGEDRVMEVARMLSGSVLTDEAVANARVLLK